MQTIALALGALLLAGGCAAGQERGIPNGTLPLEVIANVARLQGGCNVVQCPQIQYGLVVEKLVSQITLTPEQDAELSSVEACGAYGLIPGQSYRLKLFENDGRKLSVLERPLTFSGDFAKCEYFLKEAFPAPEKGND